MGKPISYDLCFGGTCGYGRHIFVEWPVDKQRLKNRPAELCLSTLVVFLIGIIAIQQFAHLEGIAADQVMPLLLNEWAKQSLMTYALAVLVVTGILAAIMSTADSVLLSLSSILAKDFLGKTVLKDAQEERLTKAGKILSWVIMAVLVLIALVPRLTLWGLTEQH